MPSLSTAKKFMNYMFKNYSKDDGKLLVHMGALGWVFSSAAQLLVLAADKNIDKKKKKFLLPQEAADAAVNVVMYYTICDFIKKGSDWLVEKGKILTKEVAEELSKIKSNTHSVSKKKKKKKLFTAEELKNGKLTKLLDNPSGLNMFKGCTDKEITPFMPAIKSAAEKLADYKNCMGIVAAVGASVLACNIVTPYVRNILASKYQKHLLKQEAVEVRKNQIKENITLRNPLPTSFKAFNNYNSFSGIKI